MTKDNILSAHVENFLKNWEALNCKNCQKCKFEGIGERGRCDHETNELSKHCLFGGGGLRLLWQGYARFVLQLDILPITIVELAMIFWVDPKDLSNA